MNGVKYYRLMRGMKCVTLAEITGLSIGTIKNMEKADQPGGISAANYRKVSDALQISVDELIKNNYPNSGNRIPFRAFYSSRTGNEHNHIYIYRKEKKMSCQQLADCLGLKTRERARQLCSDERTMAKHVEALAKHEGVSIGEFIRRYSYQEKCS